LALFFLNHWRYVHCITFKSNWKTHGSLSVL
jgi:hypothetical protein